MYENAPVQHVKFKWIGRVERSPDGRFYDSDKIRFWVRWAQPDMRPDELGLLAEVGWQPPELPGPGWYPGADIIRMLF